MTKKSNSSYLNQLLKPQKLPKKEIKPVSYDIEPEEVSSKILYSIQDLDPFLSQLESLNLFQEENENPDFYLDPKTIRSKKKQGQKIYRFVKKFNEAQIELKDQDDQLFLILDHQSVGVIDKTKARDLFSLYTKQSFESLTAFVYGGDDRWYQNIFLGGQTTYTEQSVAGTGGYNGHPASMEEYRQEIAGQGNGDHEAFDHVKQPVYIHRNCYLNGASVYEKETDAFISRENPEAWIEEAEEGVYLNMTIPEEMLSHTGEVITTEMLDMPRIVEERYEAPDGSAIRFDTDICIGSFHILHTTQLLMQIPERNSTRKLQGTTAAIII